MVGSILGNPLSYMETVSNADKSLYTNESPVTSLCLLLLVLKHLLSSIRYHDSLLYIY